MLSVNVSIMMKHPPGPLTSIVKGVNKLSLDAFIKADHNLF